MAKKSVQINLSDSFEKIPVKIFSNQKDGSAFAAKQVADFIREKQLKPSAGSGKKCVLGLSTGSTTPPQLADSKFSTSGLKYFGLGVDYYQSSHHSIYLPRVDQNIH